MNERILVVDDDTMSLRLLRRVFDKAGIAGRYCQSGEAFRAWLEEGEVPDLFLLDVHLPDANGFDLLKHIQADPVRRNVPVIFLTGDEDVKTETAGLHAGAADFIRKPFAADVLLKRVNNTIELNRLHHDMAQEIRVKTERLSRAYMQIVQALAASVDAKDKYTHGHSSRVAAYSREIARRAGFSEMELEPGRLTDEEFAVIKTHPAVGAEILGKIDDLPELKVGAHWHHERWDGRGYPNGLKGNEIPELARIIAVADTYDAMTSNRSYRALMPQDRVRAEIARCSGSQFDPRFADIMLDMIDEDSDYTMREV